MKDKDIVEIVQFTDPVCTWCWGSEPLLRKLETRFGDQLKVKFIMGGLVKDIRDFYDGFNDIGGDAEHSNRQIAKHWLEASARHGMPVQSEGFNLFSNENPSSYPQNIAYKAAQMESDELADKFLRRIREATETEARQTNRLEVLIELATEVGLDVAKFIERYTDGSAEKAFMEDLQLVVRYGVRGFPTFLVKYGEKEVLMRGYQNYEAIKSVIKAVSADKVKEYSSEKSIVNVMTFIQKYGKVAPVEIQEAFAYTSVEMEALVKDLQEKKMISVIPAGNGLLLEEKKQGLFCDEETGVCKMN
ncbi:MAG: DsbA family protein [Desulfitobacterium sp.]